MAATAIAAVITAAVAMAEAFIPLVVATAAVSAAVLAAASMVVVVAFMVVVAADTGKAFCFSNNYRAPGSCDFTMSHEPGAFALFAGCDADSFIPSGCRIPDSRRLATGTLRTKVRLIT